MRGDRGWQIGTALATLALALGAVACGSDDDDGGGSGGGSSGSAQEAPEIAWLTAVNTELVQAEEEGLTAGLEETGGSYQLFDAQFDPQKQLTQCQDAVTSGRYNVMMIYPVDGTAIRTCVQQAKNANIPVIAFEIPIGPDASEVEPQLDGVAASIVYPAAPDAERRWELIEDACGERTSCELIVTLASRADPFHAAALEVFERRAKESGFKILQVLETAYETAQTQKQLPDVLRARPEADVLVLEGDNNAIAAAEIAKEAGVDAKIIGNGGSRPGAKAIEDGTIFGSLGIWPTQAGEKAAEIATQLANGDQPSETGVNFYEMDEPVLLTKETIDEFTPEWGPTE